MTLHADIQAVLDGESEGHGRLRFIDFFAGIGGFSLGLERAGHICVGHVEINPYCRKVLKKHWPHVPQWGDIKELNCEELPEADMWCGGFPCQDLSVAGNTKKGLDGKRTGLFFDWWKLILTRRPQYVLVENSPVLLKRGLATLAGLFSDNGYDLEWNILSAGEFGAPHQRKRIYILAYTDEIYGATRVGDKQNRSSPIFAGRPAKRAEFWLQAPPERDGVDNGVSPRIYNDRVGALGNAVVPQVAEYIGVLLRESLINTERPLFQEAGR